MEAYLPCCTGAPHVFPVLGLCSVGDLKCDHYKI